ncbi:MAG TPA: histidinol dehydrogenase, partial [Bryobacteraceae bacterium]|nr:histidinol dehydrogenase [Bryobacteraceae bacterium]
MLRILHSKDMSRVLARREARLHEAEEAVRPILAAVRNRGDKGLLEYAQKFDGLTRKSVRVPASELKAAADRLTPEFRKAVEIAAANVRRFAEKQLPKAWKSAHFGQLIRPLETVGAYIPGGRYPLPSTVIMTAVPALVAGVKNICIACPRAVDEVFGTAHLLGLEHVYQMGGAQAIAAFAYGTRTV